MIRPDASRVLSSAGMLEATKPEPFRPRRASLLEGYRLWADTYDEPNPLHALEERVILPRLPDLQGKVALDLACGTGRWLKKLLGRGAKAAFGMDVSPEMLTQAAGHSLAGRVVRADCCAIPLRSWTADVITCSLAIGHLPEPGKFAKELARIARPGADVFLSDFHPAAHARGWQRTFRHGDELIAVPSFAHPLDLIRREFESTGLQVVRLDEPHIAEPEQGIFQRLGKAHLFDAARETPALYIFHFRVPDKPRLEEA